MSGAIRSSWMSGAARPISHAATRRSLRAPREVDDESPGTGLIKISLCQREINFCFSEMGCGAGKGSSRGRPVTTLQGGMES